VPEKDGILACLLLAEMTGQAALRLAAGAGDVSRNWTRVFIRARESAPVRRTEGKCDRKAAVTLRHSGKESCISVEPHGWSKIRVWRWIRMLLRLSGTEPLLRLYVEAESEAATQGWRRSSDWILKD